MKGKNMYSYTATKGKDCVHCEFADVWDMARTMARDIAAGWKISNVKQ
jgi:hypothetical protein